MVKYNLCKPEKYEKNGEEKTAWKNVGTLVVFEKDGQNNDSRNPRDRIESQRLSDENRQSFLK